MIRNLTPSKLFTLCLAVIFSFSLSVQAQNVTDDFELIDPEWSTAPADEEFLYDLDEDGEPAYVNQGGTYNPGTGNVLIPTVMDGDPQVAVLDGDNGEFIDYLPMTEDVAGGDVTLELIEMAATEDGQIFGINQVMEAEIRIYHWEDESADPEVVYNEAHDMPDESGEWAQWGQGLDVHMTDNGLRALVSGFQNSGILVLEWDDGAFTMADKLETGDQGLGGGFGTIPGDDDRVWTNGPNTQAALFNLENNEVEATVDEAIINLDHYDLDYIETEEGNFILTGPRYPDTPFSVVDVTDPDDPFLRHMVIFEADQAVENIQLTGFVNFTNDGNAVVMSSNNPVMHFELGIGGVETSGEQPERDFAKSISLDQNYPNPFNPTTTITYTLEAPADVSLDVYSVTGEHITTLQQGMQDAGSHQIEFDAGQLSSGSYIYQLQAGEQVLTRTMMLVK
ncbi:T9SS type A sorting domain-containing protein [Natronogracilivirga saccharolytica]|uniref:T9SS type A sorting domain-containing protein n=1 Tax=Natronogracilivirga saccharolytica TaxID=2812953 RepID=A0A8J7UV38_9BACT|nr:T9SS type A sorting domain-containing protein [Natronogracilivirga saccharolytica]MBP3192136.1 T9SS type A sorting domain-containing protein [Natronogracilivirga saccharolytica]